MIRRSLFAATVALLGSCSDTSNTPPTQVNFDRPVDISFACFGGLRLNEGRPASASDEVTLSAQPTTSCDIRSQPHGTNDPDPVPFGQEDIPGVSSVPPAAWYGFVLQSGPGTLAIIEFETKPASTFVAGEVKVKDANPLTPGNNAISIGEDPIAIVTDKAGCHVMTANAGSCDLSVLDVGTALDSDPAVKVDRLDVKTASGEPLRARPAAMVGEPSSTDVGFSCPATPTSLVYIAYPSCHLVAAVDTSTGTMVAGIQFDAAGAPTLVGGDVTCVDECSGGFAPTPGPRPVTLDLEHDPQTGTRRLVIGADNSASIGLVEIDENTSMPLSISQIALEDPYGDLGVTTVALSPEIGMGGSSGVIDDENSTGGPFQFVYAIATDDTVRVVDVLNHRKECDTQVDPRFLRSIRQVTQLSCLPVGAPQTPPRRAGARGPGVELPQGAIPMSVDIIRSPESRKLTTDRDYLIGTFAIVSASNGLTFVLNVDDDAYPDLFEPSRPLLTPISNAIAHQIRDVGKGRENLAEVTYVENEVQVTKRLCDSNGTTENGAAVGGPHASTTPARNVASGTYAPEKIIQLPGLRQLHCTDGDDVPEKAVSEVSFSAPEAVRDFVFPDLHALRREETWTLTWEGSLSTDTATTSVDGPAVRESQISVDVNGMRVVDQGRPFCDAGVEPFDIVQLRGCDPSVGNANCPVGYRCFVHPQSQVQGMGACMRADEADRLAETCREFLTSLRRYTVKTAESGELLLMPRRHELRTTPINGCVSDQQCQSLADYAAKTLSSSHPVDDRTPTDAHAWSCIEDPMRAPIASGKRCVMRCATTADCTPGTVCQGGVVGQPASGMCMEGVVPPQSCVNAPQRYELRAGEAFAVVGTRTGFLHPLIEDTNGRCVRDPMASPLLAGRIPLVAPACDPTADPITGRRPDGTFGPNPCSLTVTQADAVPQYNAGTCTLGNPPTRVAERQAPAIQLRNRNMTLTMVDPYYPGDQMCIADRGGALDNVPVVYPGYQLQFRQIAGFSPMMLLPRATLPVKVVRGPTNSIWVLDEGDFISSTQNSTRGKVFRIEASAPSAVSILE